MTTSKPSWQEDKSPKETTAERNGRFADGRMTEEEIREHWRDHHAPLFEHSIIRTKKEGPSETTTFRVRALTPEFAEPLFDALEKSWAWEDDADSSRNTVRAFYAQRNVQRPATLNPEYYVTTDIGDQPYAMTGLYTRDLEGQGFALRDRLDTERHYLNVGLGWFAVAPEKQQNGIGGFLHDWIVKMAAARGGKHMIVETDNSEGERAAVALYERRGYTRGFNIENYYGPNRDKHTYYAHFSWDVDTNQPFINECITVNNIEDVRRLAEKLYSPARMEEFHASLDLLLLQRDDDPVMESPRSIVHKGKNGNVAGFAVLAPSLYANAVISYWYGSEPGDDVAHEALLALIKRYTSSIGRETIIVHREGEDAQLTRSGYKNAEGGIPFVYARGDSTNFLLYSKPL